MIGKNFLLYLALLTSVLQDTTIDGLCEPLTWIVDLPAQEQNCFARCCNETHVQERWPCMSSCRPSLTRYFQSSNEYFHFLPIHIIPKTGKKVISYSLYGSDERYLCNAISIIGENRRFFPDWIIRFYVGADITRQMTNRLVNDGCEVIAVYMISNSFAPGFHGRLWRFFVADDLNVNRYMVRDADTWPIQREKDAVMAWITDATGFHVMRDHPAHDEEIQAGIWGGIVNPRILNVSKLYAEAMKREEFSFDDDKSLDQLFLKTFVWPIVQLNLTCHATFNADIDNIRCQPFPTITIWKESEFVGRIHEIYFSDCDYQRGLVEYDPEAGSRFDGNLPPLRYH